MAVNQSIRSCSVESCESIVGSHGAKGLCPSHYRASLPPCTISGCNKRQTAKGMCSMHYYRARSSGDPRVTVSGRMSRQPGVCEVEGCGQDRRKFNWCASHYAQHRRTGIVKPFQYKWGTGGYVPSHRALREKRGKASSFSCTDCGGAAEEWSYRGGCPEEVVDDRGLAFTRDMTFYDPRCIRCHRVFDDWRGKIAS